MSGPAGTTATPAPGFADPARDAQRAFRSILDALAHPGREYPLPGPAQPPAALSGGMAAVALTLLDEDVTAWFGGGLADDGELAEWLAFHTGAPRTADVGAADFAFASLGALPALERCALGSDEAPHRSATVVLDTRGGDGPARFIASGPGIATPAGLDAPWAPTGFAEAWRRNTARFPRGVDLLLVGEDSVSALPRTTRLALDPGPAA